MIAKLASSGKFWGGVGSGMMGPAFGNLKYIYPEPGCPIGNEN